MTKVTPVVSGRPPGPGGCLILKTMFFLPHFHPRGLPSGSQQAASLSHIPDPSFPSPGVPAARRSPPAGWYLVSRGMLLLSSQLSWAWLGSCAPPAGGSPESEGSVGAGLGLLLGVKLPRFRELMEAAWCWLGVWACESGGGGVRSRAWFCRPPAGSRAQTRAVRGQRAARPPLQARPARGRLLGSPQALANHTYSKRMQ